jgi:hypothetical protein
VSKAGIISEYFVFLKKHKKWWLFPVVFFLVILGLLIVLAKGSALAPFIYSLF